MMSRESGEAEPSTTGSGKAESLSQGSSEAESSSTGSGLDLGRVELSRKVALSYQKDSDGFCWAQKETRWVLATLLVLRRRLG